MTGQNESYGKIEGKLAGELIPNREFFFGSCALKASWTPTTEE